MADESGIGYGNGQRTEIMDYQNLLTLLRARRSIRRFREAPVAREDLVRLIEAASWAPSNHNRQPWRFLVLEDRIEIAALAQAVGDRLAAKVAALPALASAYAGELVHYATFFGQAPVLVVVLHKHPASVSLPLLEGLAHRELVSGEPLSVAMAVQNLLLAAHAIGLGTCVLTGPLLVPEALTGRVKLPAGFDWTCLIALGHSDEQPTPPRRKSLDQLVEFREVRAECRSDHDRA